MPRIRKSPAHQASKSASNKIARQKHRDERLLTDLDCLLTDSNFMTSISINPNARKAKSKDKSFREILDNRRSGEHKKVEDQITRDLSQLEFEKGKKERESRTGLEEMLKQM